MTGEDCAGLVPPPSMAALLGELEALQQRAVCGWSGLGEASTQQQWKDLAVHKWGSLVAKSLTQGTRPSTLNPQPSTLTPNP